MCKTNPSIAHIGLATHGRSIQIGSRHSEFLSILTLRSRITYVDKPYGSALAELFVTPHLSAADFQKAWRNLMK
jgi:hypothetical protein